MLRASTVGLAALSSVSAVAMASSSIRTNYSTLSSATLRGPFPKTDEVSAGSLWSEQPCVVFVVRRLG